MEKTKSCAHLISRIKEKTKFAHINRYVLRRKQKLRALIVAHYEKKVAHIIFAY